MANGFICRMCFRFITFDYLNTVRSGHVMHLSCACKKLCMAKLVSSNGLWQLDRNAALFAEPLFASIKRSS